MFDAPGRVVQPSLPAPLVEAGAALIGVRDRIDVALEAIPFHDTNTDVPLTSALGPLQLETFDFAFPGKVELERRLENAERSLC